MRYNIYTSCNTGSTNTGQCRDVTLKFICCVYCGSGRDRKHPGRRTGISICSYEKQLLLQFMLILCFYENVYAKQHTLHTHSTDATILLKASRSRTSVFDISISRMCVEGIYIKQNTAHTGSDLSITKASLQKTHRHSLLFAYKGSQDKF
jgi:hypothetical protein